MSTLANRQLAFQAHLETGDAAVTEAIVGDAKASAATRIAVYYRAYRLRLVEVLRNDFEGLAALLGDEDFALMVLEYLAARPSEHPSVRWVGRHLAEFLTATPPWSAQPELAEMAGFEWAWGLAFDAADAPAASAGRIAGVAADDWAGLRVNLHPSLQRVDLHYNVPALFEATSRSDALPSLQRQDAPVAWAVWRKDLVVHWRSLEPDEAWCLEIAGQGQTFGELCAGLCDWYDPDAVPLRAASLLRSWLDDGLLTDIVVG